MKEQRGQSTLIDIDGICFEIKSMIEMDYDGVWREAGFDVFVGQRKLKNFVGYPFKNDIVKAFKNLCASDVMVASHPYKV